MLGLLKTNKLKTGIISTLAVLIGLLGWICRLRTWLNTSWN